MNQLDRCLRIGDIPQRKGHIKHAGGHDARIARHIDRPFLFSDNLRLVLQYFVWDNLMGNW